MTEERYQVILRVTGPLHGTTVDLGDCSKIVQNPRCASHVVKVVCEVAGISVNEAREFVGMYFRKLVEGVTNFVAYCC